MTQTKQITKRTHRHPPFRGQLLFGWFSLFCILLIFKNGTLASQYIHRGLLICANSVIPSLFPFMVLSELLISSGFGEKLLSRITLPLCRLFLLPSPCVTAMLLGLLCGFPIGAKAVASALQRGTISQPDAERTLCISNIPSSAFVIGAVGGSLWESTRFGVALYLSVIASTLLWSIFDALRERKRTKNTKVSSVQNICLIEPKRGAKLFTDSIASSCSGILSVCAYVVFFSALMGALSAILTDLGAPKLFCASLFSLMELSQGVSYATGMENIHTAAYLSAFTCAWSGLSVHCQVISVCDGCKLSFKRYFFAKLMQAILCVLLFSCLLSLFPSLLIPANRC